MAMGAPSSPRTPLVPRWVPHPAPTSTAPCASPTLAGELAIKIGRTQLAGRAPARIVHSLSLTHHFVDAHKLLHYLF